MGDDGMGLPANMSQAEVIEIVRELLGDEDMTDQELMVAYQNGMFQELCPDIAEYAKQRQRQNESDQCQTKVKQEKEDVSSHQTKVKEEKKDVSSHQNVIKVKIINKEPEVNKVKVEKKVRHISEDENSSDEERHKHRKKKKREEHERKMKAKVLISSESDSDEDEIRDSHKKSSNKDKSEEKNRMQLSDSDDSLFIPKIVKKEKEEEGPAIKKPKIEVVNLDSESGDNSRQSHHKKKKKKHKHHKDHHKDREHKGEKDKSDKVEHKSSNGAGQSSSKEHRRELIPVKSEKPEPKPFSKYSSRASHIIIKRWTPVLDREHTRFQSKFDLKPLSIVCLDLLDLPILFHNPLSKKKNSNSIPLQSNLPLTETRESMVRRLERDKLTWFKGKLTRQALKQYRPNSAKRAHSSSSSSSSSDEDVNRKPKRHKIDSSSDSDPMVPVKKSKLVDSSRKDHSGGKLSKADKDDEAKKRRLAEIQRKALLHSKQKQMIKSTRVLPWENKDEYFKNHKKPGNDKLKANLDKRAKIESMRQERIDKDKKKNAPSTSFQRLLAQIDAANKEEAKKPVVELKIPKLSERKVVVPTEFKMDKKISVGDVANEVSRLLSSEVKVEMPVMPDASEDLGEYTVKKIAWWLLKNEKDPADYGVFHPEMHDNDELESIHSDDFDWPSDMSSIHGCVSDPEGLAADIPPDRTKINDPDWADDYCGEASLYGRMRRDHENLKDLESQNCFRPFLRIKPGTNYAKPNFEAKCFLCNELIKGQRQLGAHIRSDSHKNNWRNYTLKLVNYEEDIKKAVRKKEFRAKLVEYSVGQSESTNSDKDKSADISESKKHRVGKIERVRSDSPGPIIAGDTAANIQVHEMPIPDDISLPSIEDYDISSDESLMNVRVAIRTSGRWNEDLEKRWRTWRDEEAKLAEKYNIEREFYINEPERHPNYQEEWLKFWDRRCSELEAEGKDTENYNYQKDWMPFWLKRMQEIMKEQVEQQVYDLKRQFLIDKDSLRKLFDISKEDTKRTKKKMKVGKIENSSSLKSSSKVDSKDTHRQKMVPLSQQKHNHNRDRDRQRHHHNESRHKRDNNVNKTFRPKDHKDTRDRGYSGGNGGQYNQNFKMTDDENARGGYELDNISSSNSGIRDNNQMNPKNPKSMCSNVSSTEPYPPGEEVRLVGSKNNPSQRPNHSKSHINATKENPRREYKDEKQRAENRHNSDDARINNNTTKLEPVTKIDTDRISDDSSTTGNARAAQSSLQALREAMAKEESRSGTHTNSSAKIGTHVKNTAKNLEDGEVASDISSLAGFDPASKGVSSFINKSIPGLTAETAIDKDKLDKNSLGYHLLERRKSSEQHNSSNYDKSKPDQSRPPSKYESKDKHKYDHKHSKGAKHNLERKDSHGSFHGSNHHHRNRKKKKGHNRNEKWDHQKRNKGGNYPHAMSFQNNSNPAYYNNSKANVPQAQSEPSWELEESWDTTPAANPWEPPPPSPSAHPWEPPPQSPTVNSTVPIVGNIIPVLSTTTRELQHPQPPHPPPQQNFDPWNSSQQWGSWNTSSPYPPQPNFYR